MADATDAPRGAFVVFEGVDRCGKSSQTRTLVEALNASGTKAELWCYPDRTTDIGKMINAYLTNNADLSDAAVHLLFSANRWEKRCVKGRERARNGDSLRFCPHHRCASCQCMLRVDTGVPTLTHHSMISYGWHRLVCSLSSLSAPSVEWLAVVMWM
jgi:hypothetical protein